MGSQDQHRQTEPQTAAERRAAQAANARQIDAHRRIYQAQHTAGATVPTIDELLDGDDAA
ncbi:hypothetical protein ACGFZG_08740 [Streptomyces antibioticus]|uniref:hypothetical protein n=1 Tax=Streptomyces antibioticus TaxID=1890 RepID=UPI003724BE1D